MTRVTVLDLTNTLERFRVHNDYWFPTALPTSLFTDAPHTQPTQNPEFSEEEQEILEIYKDIISSFSVSLTPAHRRNILWTALNRQNILMGLGPIQINNINLEGYEDIVEKLTKDSQYQNKRCLLNALNRQKEINQYIEVKKTNNGKTKVKFVNI